MNKNSVMSVSSTLKGNRLSSTVTVPKRLRKYISSPRLFAHYDAPLTADMSILNIPLVSTILPLAWLTGTDVHVEKLDKKYVEAMNAIKQEFRQMFPRGKFTTKIIVDDLVENKTRSHATAMLFSGGVDSTYALINNSSLKPRLIMFFGVVGYQLHPTYKRHNRIVKKTFSDFAKREGFNINFVDTNTCQILNASRITHDFNKTLQGKDLWRTLQLPLVLLGLPAPLSIGRFNRLSIAADSSPASDYAKYPYASQPRINEKFAWADLNVTLDGYVDRFNKTSLIKEYLKNHEYRLRVCNDPPLDGLNCSTCEKCGRTIVPLILDGVDPNDCGFTVNRSTLDVMRINLERKRFAGSSGRRWKMAQNLIPNEIETDMLGSRDLLMWLRNLDIDSVCKKGKLHKRLSNTLPYPLAMLFDAFYSSAKDPSAGRSINSMLSSFLRRRVEGFT